MRLVYKTTSFWARDPGKMSSARRHRRFIDWPATLRKTLELDGEVWLGRSNAAGIRSAAAMVRSGELVFLGTGRPFAGEGLMRRYGSPAVSRSRPVLVIQCGGSKREGVHRMGELYLGPLWSTYRARLRERLGTRKREGLPGHPDFDVYVLSAEYGLLGEAQRCPSYDRVLVPDAYPRERKGGTPVRRLSELVGILKEQPELGELEGPLHFAGGRLYAEALRGAGLEVAPVSTGDLLAIRKALSELLGGGGASGAVVLDLDSLFEP